LKVDQIDLNGGYVKDNIALAFEIFAKDINQT
jgi:hypothetical protein